METNEPRIKIPEENGLIKLNGKLADLFEIKLLIKQIEQYDRKPKYMEIIVDSLSKELTTASNGTINVRKWYLNDNIHVAVIYKTTEIRDLIYGSDNL